MRTRLRRRRERARLSAPRGTFCEDRMYSGPYFGARCVFRAVGYQARNDIYVCGVHARAYLNVTPLQEIRDWNAGNGPAPALTEGSDRT